MPNIRKSVAGQHTEIAQWSVAIFMPLYVTKQNESSWLNYQLGVIDSFPFPVFYGISYPEEGSWDSVRENAVKPDNLDDIISRLDPQRTLYSAPYVTHDNSVIRAQEALAKKGYRYMMHLEQDVIVRDPMVLHEIMSTFVGSGYPYAFLDLSLANSNFLPDISLFCVNLEKCQEALGGSSFVKAYASCTVHSTGVSDTWALGPDRLLIYDKSFEELLHHFKIMLNTVSADFGGGALEMFPLRATIISRKSFFIDVFRGVILHLLINNNLLVLTDIGNRVWHYNNSRKLPLTV